jgi:methionyl-tRNA formyltransferase
MVEAAGLRVVFFGTPAFSVPTLDALLASRHPVVGVVSQPDRPRGRGHRTTDAPVKARALTAGLPILQPPRLADPAFHEALARLSADIGVVAAYGKILSEAVLAIPARGMINVHASLLPRYRGAAPVHRAVMAGERETGVTIMRVVKALDAGPMLATVRRLIGDDETSEDVERDLAKLGAGLLVATLDRMVKGQVDEIPQDDSMATYASRLTKEEGAIAWSKSAAEIHNQIRGLQPWPRAYSYAGGHRIILLRSAVSQEASTREPGGIVALSDDHLSVATGSGVLQLLELQPEGKRPMNVREFLAGHRLDPGDSFSPGA